MRIHHVALRTADLARLTEFYTTVLGLPVVRQSGERSVWLDAGGTIVMLEVEDGGEPAIPDGSKELVAFAIGAEEHALYTDRLSAHGIVVEDRTDYSMYFRDPDGRRVGLSSYPDRAHRANGEM
jgi:catechol 2,3-dioxygenase-like lactoylglutathione lyase family enzyme